MVTKRKETFKMKSEPQVLEDSQVIWENYRFSVLTSAMIRVEFDPNGAFEDSATQTVLNRDFPTPEFKLKETDEYIEIITTHVHLHFHKEEGGFTKNNLHIEALGNYSLYHSSWYFGDQPKTLKGTARTLDFSDGPIELEEGLMSKNGYSIIDDSRSMRITDDGWVEKRPNDIVDIYFLGYGRDYLGTLRDYHHLTGHTPMLPRYALGNWWSRYYAYSQSGYKKLIREFGEKQIPFSVAVLDMDWHMTDIPPEYGSGWTGYTWNKELFPEPEEFLNWLHKQGMRTTLNLHPANGVQPFEEMYEPMAKELNVDYSSNEPISFDIADTEFLNAYFEYLHHPHEEIGVDFWWIDWQQGSVTKVEGLDPLWMLNHYHFMDHGRGDTRPLIFSRYAGLGSHRYPIGFSGDTASTWDALNFQPYFTATAANVGYNWWSHDIGGHLGGVKDSELFIRWVQYGVFSPINRLHSQDGEFSGKEPWRYGLKAERVVTDFMQLRHKLIPYLYTMNVLTHKDNLPLIRPMYYHHPWEDEAYDVPNQYYFGTQLLVAPITSPLKGDLRLARVKTWLPEGMWIDFFNGRVYEGGRVLDVYRPVTTMPVFAKAGGIVPMDQSIENATDNPDKMDIRVFAGADGSFSIYEDDGLGKNADSSTTKMTLKWHQENTDWSIFQIHEPEGNLHCLPEKRQFTLTFVGFAYDTEPEVYVRDQKIDAKVSKKGRFTTIEIPEQAIEASYYVRFKGVSAKKNDMFGEVFSFLDRAQLSTNLKEKIYTTVRKNRNSARVISGLLALDIDPDLLEALSELIWANPGDID
ncbi:glycoside hydrolase family 31 protein [Marinilactibacillus kalidii]|uniref:glycoside hydrolase family 31 protein n=1 Tax=Marinilactibacillus kalidii TaxID=2820274 RepID=UPI001ABEC66F|nr:glycoside hydrolase family 31 protein [Marinilactibacillus kalidii]